MFKRKTVIITGSSGKVGRSLAIAFARDGWNIALHYNDSNAKAISVSSIIRDHYDIHCELFNCDFSDSLVTDNFVRLVFEKFGRVDCIVNSASFYVVDSIKSMDSAAIYKMFSINIAAVIVLIRSFFEFSSHGTVINIGDRLHPFSDNRLVYYMTKKSLHDIQHIINLFPNKRHNSCFTICPAMIYPYITEDEYNISIKRNIKIIDIDYLCKIVVVLARTKNNVISDTILNL